jgi:hypothetical protein
MVRYASSVCFMLFRTSLFIKPSSHDIHIHGEK